MMWNNKKSGTQFEKEFAFILAEKWFWVHLFQDNRNGQPCDVIAAKDGAAYLFDCKDCELGHFPLNRMEENQYNAMKLFQLTGNRSGMFAIRFPGQEIYLVDFEVLKKLRDKGMKRITQEEIHIYGRPLDDWLDEVAGGDACRGENDEDTDWQ